MNNLQFYTYIWLREDETPYYIGKGKGQRAFSTLNHNVPCPKDRTRIKVIYCSDEDTALAYEIYLIDFYGRKDNGTGILRNLTDGGGKNSGYTNRIPWNKGLRGKQTSWRKGKTELFTGDKNPFFGRKHSEETKQKIREAKLIHGRYDSRRLINKNVEFPFGWNV